MLRQLSATGLFCAQCFSSCYDTLFNPVKKKNDFEIMPVVGRGFYSFLLIQSGVFLRGEQTDLFPAKLSSDEFSKF